MVKLTQECYHCGSAEGLKRCSQCKVTLYCSTGCRDNDYKTHKKYCHSFSTTEKYRIPSPKIKKGGSRLKGVTTNELKKALKSFYGEGYITKALYHITENKCVHFNKNHIPSKLLSGVNGKDIEDISEEETERAVLGRKRSRREREEEVEEKEIRKRVKETPGVRVTDPRFLSRIAQKIISMVRKVWNGAYGIMNSISWPSLFNTPIEKLQEVLVILETNLNFVLSMRGVRQMSATVATKFGEALCAISDRGRMLLEYVYDNYLFSNEATSNFERGDLIEALEQVGSCSFLVGVYRSSSPRILNTEIFETVFRIARSLKNMVDSIVKNLSDLARESIGFLVGAVNKAVEVIKKVPEKWKAMVKAFKMYSTRIMITIVALVSQLTEWAEEQPVNLVRTGMEFGGGLFSQIKSFFGWIMEKMGISTDSSGNVNSVSQMGNMFLQRLSQSSMVRSVMGRIPGILTTLSPLIVTGWKVLKFILKGYVIYALFGMPSLVIFALRSFVSLAGDHFAYAAHSVYGHLKRGSIGKWIVARQVQPDGDKIDMDVAQKMEKYWGLVEDVARKMVQLPDGEPFTRKEKMELLRKMRQSTQVVSKAQQTLKKKLLGADKKFPSYKDTWKYSAIFAKIYYKEPLEREEKEVFNKATEGRDMEVVAEHVRRTASELNEMTLQYAIRYIRYQTQKSSVLSGAKDIPDLGEVVAQPAIPPEKMEVAKLASEERKAELEKTLEKAKENVEAAGSDTEKREEAETTLKDVEETKGFVADAVDTIIPASSNLTELETNEAATNLVAKTAENTVDQHALEEGTRKIMNEAMITGITWTLLALLITGLVFGVMYKLLMYYRETEKQAILDAVKAVKKDEEEILKQIKVKAKDVGRASEEAVHDVIRNEPVFAFVGGYKETLRDTMEETTGDSLERMFKNMTMTVTDEDISNSLIRNGKIAVQKANTMALANLKNTMSRPTTMSDFFRQYKRTLRGGIREVFAGDTLSVEMISAVAGKGVSKTPPEGMTQYAELIRDVMSGKRDLRSFSIKDLGKREEEGIFSRMKGYFAGAGSNIVIQYKNAEPARLSGAIPDGIMNDIINELKNTPEIGGETAWLIFSDFLIERVYQRVKDMSGTISTILQSVMYKQLNYSLKDTVESALYGLSNDINLLKEEGKKVKEVIKNLTGEDFDKARKSLELYGAERRSIKVDSTMYMIQALDTLWPILLSVIFLMLAVYIITGLVYTLGGGTSREEGERPLTFYEKIRNATVVSNSVIRSIGSMFIGLVSGLNAIAWALSGILITFYIQSNVAYASEIGKQWTTDWLPTVLGLGAFLMIGKTLGGSLVGGMTGSLAAMTSAFKS